MTKPIHHNCAKCGKAFNGNRDRKYCSQPCARSDRGPAWNRGTSGGKGKPKTRVEKTCEGCGETFEAFAYHAATRRFCNMTCYHKTRWDGVRSGMKDCEHCGTPFAIFDCDARRFCSHPCYAASGAGAKSGAESPQWKGGTSPYYHRGADWPVSSEAARVRDGRKCKNCGKAESDMDGIRRKLDVHHIVPWSVSKSNAIENLVTLCRSCHHRNEPRPEIVTWLLACPTHQTDFLAAARSAWGLQ